MASIADIAKHTGMSRGKADCHLRAATSAGNRASAPKALRLLELKVAGIRATGPRNAEAKELLKTFAYASQTAIVTGKTLAAICQEFGMI